jgi:hypothetical protein
MGSRSFAWPPFWALKHRWPSTAPSLVMRDGTVPWARSVSPTQTARAGLPTALKSERPLADLLQVALPRRQRLKSAAYSDAQRRRPSLIFITIAQI